VLCGSLSSEKKVRISGEKKVQQARMSKLGEISETMSENH